MTERRDGFAASGLAALSGLVCAATMGFLLTHLVFDAWSHSFDTGIYAQSLDNIAHGRSTVTFVGIRNLAVHLNLILYALSPLVAFARPQTILIAAQSIAFGATAYLTVRQSLVVASNELGTDAASRMLTWLGATLLLLASPVVVNPFLFDVRPDQVAIPLIIAGLLRVFRSGSWDLTAFLLMGLALLVREEWSVVIAAGLAFAPLRDGFWAQWKPRLGGIIFAALWIITYWYIVRPAMNDGSGELAGEVSQSFFSGLDADVQTVLLNRVEILCVVTLGFGGLALLGWRWLPIALPGLVLILATTRLEGMTLNLHYVQFCVPGVVLAAVAGFERALARDGSRAPLALLLFVASGMFFWSSALPGGGRYRQENFALLCSETTPLTCEATDMIRAIHSSLDEYPDIGLAVPLGFTGQIGDRAWAQSTETIQAAFNEGEIAPPQELDGIMLFRDRWQTVGRAYVELYGFQLVSIHSPGYAMLLRDSDPPHSSAIGELSLGDYCEAATPWEAAGVGICAYEYDDEGHLVVFLERNGASPVVRRGGVLVVRPPGDSSEHSVPLVVGEGLLSIGALPANGVFRARSVVPVPRTPARLDILDPSNGGESLVGGRAFGVSPGRR